MKIQEDNGHSLEDGAHVDAGVIGGGPACPFFSIVAFTIAKRYDNKLEGI